MKFYNTVFSNPLRFRTYRKLLLVLPEHRTSLFLNPKVGTTSLKRIILEGLYSDSFKKGGAVHSQFSRLETYGSNSSLREIRCSMNSDDYQRYIFVRNPYHRVLSAYLDKFSNPNQTSIAYRTTIGKIQRFANKHSQSAETGDCTVPFSTFVHWLANTSTINMNFHWAPQNHISLYKNLDYQHVFKYEENFSTGVKQLANQLGISNSVVSKNLNKPMNTSKSDHLYYDENLANIVYQCFRDDFELFGYDRNTWQGS